MKGTNDLTVKTQPGEGTVNIPAETSYPLSTDELRRFIDINSEDPLLSNSADQQEHSNHVYNILKRTLDGRAILSTGQKQSGLLDAASRRRLSQLIIGYELEKNPEKSITKDEFIKWSLDIATIFPQESPLVYYTAYIAATNYQSKRNASGKLYEAYCGRRKLLRKRGDISYTPRSKSFTNTSRPNSPTPSGSSEHENFTNSDDLLWLQNYVNPWKLVLEKWEATRVGRLRVAKEPGLVGEYFKKFPCLTTPQGYTLLLEDYKYLYPGTDNNLFSKILSIRHKIIEKATQVESKELKELLAPYLSLLDDDNQDCVSSYVSLLCLPFLLPLTVGKRSLKKAAWRPSRIEVRDGFITQIASEDHLLRTIENRKNKLAQLRATFQPMVIYVGSSASTIKSAYVVVDSTLFKFDNLLQAVDVAFKVFHSTNAEYPEEAENVWLVIQRGIYNVTRPHDRITSGVRSLLVDLGFDTA